MSHSELQNSWIKKIVTAIQSRRQRNRWLRKVANSYKVVAAREEPLSLDDNAYRNRWAPMLKNVDTRWYHMYSLVSRKPDLDYVPEDIYYLHIEPKLNRCEFYRAYRDKNIYDKFIPAFRDIFPEVFLRNIEGVFYDRDYRRIKDVSAFLTSLSREKLVVKPTIETGSGRNVNFFVRSGQGYADKQGVPLSRQWLDQNYGANYLIQDYIRQHEYFARFNPTSLNSIRITTYRSVRTEEVAVLHANLRMGGKGAWVDNQNAGGVAIHVNEDGTLNPYATERYGNKFFSPPANPSLKFTEAGPVPHFAEMKEAARRIAAEYHYFRMLGFDFCLEDNGVVRLIEINFCGLGTNFQMDSGSLFGSFTGEVIEYCAPGKA